MGKPLGIVNTPDICNQVDLGAVYFSAAQRYQWLREMSLRTGHGNAPMVRLGNGTPLDGHELDFEVEQAMRKWPLLVSKDPAAAGASLYRLSPIEAAFLRKVVQASTTDRMGLLTRYAKSAGIDDLVRVLAHLIGCANAVIENCKAAASDLLVTEGGLHPHVAEDLNMPTLAGAMSGLMLVDGIDPRGACSGCVYRQGSHANQSPVTTEDAAYTACVGKTFMCHEGLDARGNPTKVCIGHAKALKADESARDAVLGLTHEKPPETPPAASRPHQWSQDLPDSSGIYWNWGGQPGVEAELVRVRRSTAEEGFSVSEGQLGLAQAVPCAQWGGWWAPVQKPDARSEIEAGHFAHPAASTPL